MSASGEHGRDGSQFQLKRTSYVRVRGPTGRVYVSDRLEAPSDLRLGAPNRHSKFGLDCSITVAVHSEHTHTHTHGLLYIYRYIYEVNRTPGGSGLE